MKEKYVYLDWNAFKYLKDNDKSDFSKKLLELKEKYRVPYSLNHLCDLQKNYSPDKWELVKSDLDFLVKYTDGYLLGTYEGDYNLSNQFNIYDKFEEIYNYNKLENTFNIADEKLDKIIDEIKLKGFKEFFKGGNENLFPIIMKQGMSRFNANYKLYKLYRDIILSTFSESKEAIFLENIKQYPLNYSVFKDAVNTFFIKFGNKSNDKNKLVFAYSLLDYNEHFKEKISRKSNFSNIYNDGEHLSNAKDAEMYITRDEALIERGKYVFNAYEIKTPIYSIKKFSNLPLG